MREISVTKFAGVVLTPDGANCNVLFVDHDEEIVAITMPVAECEHLLSKSTVSISAESSRGRKH